MTPASLIRRGRSFGVTLMIGSSGKLKISYESEPPPTDFVDALKVAKANILAHLRSLQAERQDRANPNLRDCDLLAKVNHLDRLIATKPHGPVTTWRQWRRHFQEVLESRSASA